MPPRKKIKTDILSSASNIINAPVNPLEDSKPLPADLAKNAIKEEETEKLQKQLRKEKREKKELALLNQGDQPKEKKERKPRKLKNQLTSISIEPVNELVDASSENKPEIVEEKQVKQRKSKKYQVVAIITPDGIQGNLQSEQRKPLIAHLPIHSSDVKFHDQPLIYDPTPPPLPVAFDAGMTDPFSSEANYEFQTGTLMGAELDKGNIYEYTIDGTQIERGVDKESEKTTGRDNGRDRVKDRDNDKDREKEREKEREREKDKDKTKDHVSKKSYGPTQLLVEYAHTKEKHVLPSSVTTACFWCCETFDTQPCILPTACIDDVWHVYGNFCTPMCSMAYLLSELLDTHMRWERIAMLNRLYGKECNGRVYPAPNREVLQRFGGPISAADYRELCQSQRIRVDIHMPPMVSILASMDTKPIDFYETSLQNKMTTVQPIHRSEETGLKLRRSKPLKDRESTLDSCLNIQHKTY